jgi:sec-independent protein translocase protein TatA
MIESLTTLAFFGPIGGPELLILALLGVLIFGKRLPEVGKSLGKGIVEFKKGVAGVQEQIDEQASRKNEPLENKDDAVEVEDVDENEQKAAHGSQNAHGSSPST